jgi:hypothetical protein
LKRFRLTYDENLYKDIIARLISNRELIKMI